MRYLITILLICLLAVPALAVDKVLVGDKLTHGGYGALTIKFTNINGDFEPLVGARGAWVINHCFAIGLAGYGLADNWEDDDFIWPDYPYEHLGYGGLFLEFIHKPHEVVHFTFSALIGGGSYGTDDVYWYPYDNDWEDFFIFEPEVGIELNVTRHFRIGMGGSYRFIDGDNHNLIPDDELDGAAASLTFKFGWF